MPKSKLILESKDMKFFFNQNRNQKAYECQNMTSRIDKYGPQLSFCSLIGSVGDLIVLTTIQSC